ncbi:hypothetical protein HDU82_009325, partial [Entophlyctis luteolus]
VTQNHKAKRRFVSQTRVRALESELEELKSQLAMEQMQLNELRAKMQELQDEQQRNSDNDSEFDAEAVAESNEEGSLLSASAQASFTIVESPEPSFLSEKMESIAVSNNSSSAESDIQPKPISMPPVLLRQSITRQRNFSPIVPVFQLDSQLQSDLRVFMRECGATKLSKLHTLAFLKTCLEEDVTACLKFGGHPRTNTRKFVDAILANTCFVEEMNAAQIADVEKMHAEVQHALEVQSNAQNPSAVVAAAAAVGSAPDSPGTTNNSPATSPAKLLRESLVQANQVLHGLHNATKDSATHALFTTTLLSTLSTWTSRGTATLPASVVVHGCATCGTTPAPTPFRFKIGNGTDSLAAKTGNSGSSDVRRWVAICASCRDRVVAVCEFYAFVRHLRLGLYSTRAEADVLREVVALRIKMWEARCGGGVAGISDATGGLGGRAGSALRPDSTVIVTGASRGIGLATVQALLNLDAGLAVVGVSRTPASKSTDLQNLLKTYALRFGYVAGDVCTEETQEAVIAAALRFGGISAVVFNAGVLHPIARLATVSADDVRKLLEINVVSILSLAQRALPHLRVAEGGGRMIFVSSGAATSAYAGWGAYCMSKAALNMLAATFAVEEPSVVSVAFRPGVVDSAMQEAIRDGQAAGAMDSDKHAYFVKLHEDGELLAPSVPGGILAGLSVRAGQALNGQFVSWNDARLEEFRAGEAREHLVVFPPASPPAAFAPGLPPRALQQQVASSDADIAFIDAVPPAVLPPPPPQAVHTNGPRTEAEAMPKEFRAQLPRVTCYCAADGYDLSRTASFLRAKHGVVGRRIDECLYISYAHTAASAAVPSAALVHRHCAKLLPQFAAAPAAPLASLQPSSRTTLEPVAEVPIVGNTVIVGTGEAVTIPLPATAPLHSSPAMPSFLLMPGMYANFPDTHLTDPHLASPPAMPDEAIEASVDGGDGSYRGSTDDVEEQAETAGLDNSTSPQTGNGLRRRFSSSRHPGSSSSLSKLTSGLNGSGSLLDKLNGTSPSRSSTPIHYLSPSGKYPADNRWMGRNEVFIFDFGVVVLWNFTAEEENLYLSILKPFALNPRSSSDAEIEDFHFQYDFTRNNQPRIYNDMITLKSGNPMIKLTISHGISQSAKLTHFENIMEQEIARTTSLPKMMAKYGEVKLKRDDVMKIVGNLFRLRMDVNLVSNVLDTPEIFWSEPELQGLYNAVRGYLEISQRVKLLNKRTEVISDLLDMLSDHLHGSQMTMMTRIVIVLIVITCMVAGAEVYVKVLLDGTRM